MRLCTNHVTLTHKQRIIVMMKVHPPQANTLKRRTLLLNLNIPILSSHKSAAPVTHLLPEASDLLSDPLPNNQSACMDNYASTAKSTLSVCPTTPLIATDQTSSENIPSSSNSPTHLVLTTFDEHEDSNLKTTLAASISKLVKGDENLLKEFDELRSTLKEAKKTRD